MFCPKCGNEVRHDEDVCSQCGAVMPLNNQVKGTTIEKSGKKIKKSLIIDIVVRIGVLVTVGLTLLAFVIPNIKYNKAVELSENGKFNEALEAFSRLGNYKNSEEMIQKMYYDKACDYMDEGLYVEAIGIFSEYNGYSNSQELKQECQNWLDYEEAAALFDAGNYEQAKSMFIALDKFKESRQFVRDCQVRLDYTEAADLFKAGDYQAAKSLFENAAGYEDSESLALVCECKINYDAAIEKMSAEEYHSALELLDGIENDIADSGLEFSIFMDKDEFDAIKNDSYSNVCYNNGKNFYDNGFFYSAYLEYQKISGFLDADQLAASCVQPIKTEVLYLNSDYAKQEAQITFSVKSNYPFNVCVKIYSSGDDLVSVWLVKIGETLRVKLPIGIYYFHESEGVEWFGEKEYFGDEGNYYLWIFDEEFGMEYDYKKTFMLGRIFIIQNEGKGNIELNIITRDKF